MPLVNDPTDQDLWGGELNGNASAIDSLLYAALNYVILSESGNFTIVAPTPASSTIGSTKTLYICNAFSAAIIASLPASATAQGMCIAFKKADNSTNTITIQAHSSEMIDAANTLILAAQYDFVVLACDGSNWNIIAVSPDISFNNAALTGVPTAPTAAIGTATTQIATTLFASPSSSLATTGYTELPNGLFLQWGKSSVGITPGGSVSITFPQSLTTACYFVSIQPISYTGADNGLFVPYVDTLVTTGFTAHNTDSNTTVATWMWMAIGK